MRKTILCLTILLLTLIVSHSVRAQDYVISGFVIAASGNQPLEGVQVTVQETGNQTFTDHNGKFAIDPGIQGKVTLTFTAAGLKSASRKVDSSVSQLVVALETLP